MVWESIPAQLSKENKKFIYGVIREGARAKDFELAIQWLTALAEQYVFQQLLQNEELSIYYHAFGFGNSKYEIDFLIQNEDDEVIPIEVKAGECLKSNSFRLFCQKNKPKKAIRTSLADYKEEEWLTSIPLYAVNSI